MADPPPDAWGADDGSGAYAVPATLLYTKFTGHRQRSFAPGVPKPAGEPPTAEVPIKTRIIDARRGYPGGEPRLSECGFELTRHPTRLAPREFYDSPARVSGHYRAEMVELVKRCTGAAHAVCMHTMVRNSSEHARVAGGAGGAGEAGAKSDVQGPAPVVHADYSTSNALDIFDKVAKGPHRRGRFAVINAWRNISETPIERDHLAVCDPRTVVAPDDYVPFVHVDAHRENHNYRLAPGRHSLHRWYYFPHMERDEVLLFMQYDSDPLAPARYTFHTSFNRSDGYAAVAAAPRQSVEARCIAFFPDFVPDTVPRLHDTLSSGGRVEHCAHRVRDSLTHASAWPPDAVRWMKLQLHKAGDGAVRRVAQILVDESAKRREAVFEDCTPEELQRVVDALVATDEFERTAKAHFPPVEDLVGAAVESIIASVSAPERWPDAAVQWMRGQLYKRDGVAGAVDVMVKEGAKKGHHSLDCMSAEQRQAVKRGLLAADNPFESIAKAHFPPAGIGAPAGAAGGAAAAGAAAARRSGGRAPVNAPGAAGAKDVDPSAVVAGILRAVAHPDLWPARAATWMRNTIHAEGGVQVVVTKMVASGAEKSKYGMSPATPRDVRDTVIAMLLSSDEFERQAKMHFPR